MSAAARRLALSVGDILSAVRGLRASGVSFMLMSIWFWACIYHWYGLTYRTAWPILLVIFGGEMIFASLLERLNPVAPAPEKEEHHA